LRKFAKYARRQETECLMAEIDRVATVVGLADKPQ
jgi:hypothetical protein